MQIKMHILDKKNYKKKTITERKDRRISTIVSMNSIKEEFSSS